MNSCCCPADLDLRTVCNELGEVKDDYFKIGVQLGISLAVLKRFKEEEDPLAAVIDYWLRGNTASHITWHTIVEALKSAYVGKYDGLADRIYSKYCSSDTALDSGKA